jgi:CRP/FNR family transcriptional regulator, cyclic AMP receptor protein
MTDSLSAVPLFQTISLNGLSSLAELGEVCHFTRGETLMRQGDTSDCLYVIVSGMVRVERSHPELLVPVHLADLTAGTTVGEMGVLDEAPRSATVTAIEDTETLRLSTQTLERTMARHPEVASSLLHILSKRLRSTDELMAHLASKGHTEHL